MHFSTIKKAFKYQNFFWNKLSFGFKIAFWGYLNEVNPTKKVFTNKIKYLIAFAEKEFKPIIKKYEDFNGQKGVYQGKIPVWVFWWQDFENRPELVKTCNKSVEKFIPKEQAEIIYVTKENLNEYISVPDEIMKKLEKGKMTIMAFSDVVRYSLLAKYGGMWIDSTVLITEPISVELMNSDFFTLKIFDENKYPKEPSRAKWNNFLWCAKPNNLLFLFARDCLIYYWQKHNKIVDYILPDYVIITAYNNFNSVKEQIDFLQANIHDFMFTLQNLNEVFSLDLFEKIKKNSQFHKLTYKWDLKEEKDGEKTVYGYIRNDFLN